MTLEFDLAQCMIFSPSVAAAGKVAAEANEVTLFLPTWTPGSYLIREYSRHLSRVEAIDPETGTRIPCQKVSKNRFQLSVGGSCRRVQVTYRVYAHELSVRTADLTTEHAYWNHACVLLWPLDKPQLKARLTVVFPAGWDLACAIPSVTVPREEVEAGTDARRLVASNMEHAFDSPCLVGKFGRLDWKVGVVEHTTVLDGLGGVSPPETLVDDLKAIVEATMAVFGGELPYPHYLFLCLFAADGHGGLEHGESATLLMSRTAFASEKGYREFLSLAAHELFHAWNVKRMRPVELWSYDYENENYTGLLWLVEGWTAYYDDLLCLRAGLTTRSDYLATISKSIQTMLTAPGRLQMSLQDSSFDAWIRLYRPDENTRNSSQNYYVNGSVAAMCLDLLLRSESAGTRCLDDVLRELYVTTFAQGRGYSMDDVVATLGKLAGDGAVSALRMLVTSFLEPNLQTLFAAFGIRLVNREADRPYLGITFESGGTKVASVTAGAAAHHAAIAPGDEVLAIQNLRVDGTCWQDVFQAAARVDQPLEVLLSRRGVITRCIATPRRGHGTVTLEIDEDATPHQQALRDGWLPTHSASKRAASKTVASGSGAAEPASA